MAIPQTLDAATLRRLAVAFDVDPRTILKVLRGEPVRGMARERAQRALASLDAPSEVTKTRSQRSRCNKSR